VRVFKNGWFQRFSRKEGITDASLCEAVARASRGLVDADLGSRQDEADLKKRPKSC